MRRPSSRTMFLAHPLVAVPVAMSGAAVLYAAWSGASDGVPLGLFGVVMLVAVSKAKSEADVYRQWQREWDAMAGGAPPSRAKFKGSQATVLGALVVVSWLCLWSASLTTSGNLLVWGALVAVSIAVLAWWRKRRQRAARPKAVVPVQVVAVMAGPVPTLDAAYAGLPEHLQRLTRRPGR